MDNNEAVNAISSVLKKINQVKEQLEHELGKSISHRRAMEEMGLPSQLINDLEKVIGTGNPIIDVDDNDNDVYLSDK
jgi:DNA-directed RNA polymerase sigma subunit (sigma70/sigma32)